MQIIVVNCDQTAKNRATGPRHGLFGRLLLLLGLLTAAPAFAEPAQIQPEQHRLELSTHLRYLVSDALPSEPDALFAAAGRDEFKRLPAAGPTFGFTDQAYWFHTRLYNNDENEQRWLLVLQYALLDRIDIYLRYPDGRLEHMTSGDLLPFHARGVSYRHPNFWIDLPYRTEVQLLIRAESRSSLQVPLSLFSPAAFAEMERDAQLGIGLYYGVLMALLLYNLVLWLALREAAHFWYMLHVSGFGLVLFCLNGLAFEYLWPNSPTLANLAIPLSMALSQMGMHQFCRVFLELPRRQPGADRIARAFLLFFVVMGAAAPFIDYQSSVRPMTLAVFPGVIFILYQAINAVRGGYRPARLFLAAWAALLLGIALYASVSFGTVGKNFITEYGIQIGSALEMILLSFAVAYRYASLREQNDRMVREANEQLERNVARRTAELSNALEQLADANTRLRESSRRDALTGVFNRRHFREVFEGLLGKSGDLRPPLGLLLIDLDHFKRINDTYGHLAGDDCLRAVCAAINDALQPHNAVLARFGGEEFVVLVPDIDAGRLAELAELLRARIFALQLRSNGRDIPMSASIGVFALPSNLRISPDDALHHADEALYAAKNAGRNRVQVAKAPTPA